MQAKSYRLGQYRIVEQSNGEIGWEAHKGLATLSQGKCFIQGDILFLGPSESEEASLFKREFLESLRRHPPWNRTAYYCTSYSIHPCSPDSGRDKAVSKASTRSAAKSEPAAPVQRNRMANEVAADPRSHTERLVHVAGRAARYLYSVKPHLPGLKLRRKK